MTHLDYGLSPEVAEVGKMNISGNVTPLAWYKTLTYANGKPHLVAITLLGDIVYWFRPREIRDATGQFVRWVKKFKGEWLRRKRMSFADMYGLSLKQVDDGLDYLVELGVIKRRILPRIVEDGKVLFNVLEIMLQPAKLEELTYPDLQGGSRLQATPPQDVVANGAAIPQDMGVSPTGERGIAYRREGYRLQARGVSPTGETDSEITDSEITDSEIKKSTLQRRVDFILAQFGFPLVNGQNYAEFGQLVDCLDDATFEAIIAGAVTVSPRIKSWARLKPLLVHPVVKDFMDLAEQPLPPLAVCRDIIATVSDRALWQEVVRAYCGRYANRAYVDAMLDWYRQGGAPVPQKRAQSFKGAKSERTQGIAGTNKSTLSPAAQRKLERLRK